MSKARYLAIHLIERKETDTVLIMLGPRDSKDLNKLTSNSQSVII